MLVYIHIFFKKKKNYPTWRKMLEKEPDNKNIVSVMGNLPSSWSGGLKGLAKQFPGSALALRWPSAEDAILVTQHLEKSSWD